MHLLYNINMNDNLISYARARFDHERSKLLLKEKYEAKMLFTYNQGMWQAGPELLNTLSACDASEIVLLDLYTIPIQVNTKELRTLTQQRWQEQMTAWLIEYNEIKNNR